MLIILRCSKNESDEQKRGCAAINMNKKRKSLIKSPEDESNDDQDPHSSVKVKKKHSIPSTSTSTSPASSSPESSASLIPKVEEISWDGLQDAKVKNLLGTTGIVKNPNRMRFQIKTISLKDEI